MATLTLLSDSKLHYLHYLYKIEKFYNLKVTKQLQDKHVMLYIVLFLMNL